MKVFTPADETVLELIRDRRSRHYPDLDEAGVTFSVLIDEKLTLS